MKNGETLKVQKLLFHYPVEKQILLKYGDILEEDGTVDLLICSVFQNSYRTDKGGLLESLSNIGISIEELSENRDICSVNERCWLSEELPHRDTGLYFRRIACLELLNASEKNEIMESNMDLLLHVFNDLEQLLYSMEKNGYPLRSIATIVPATGNQNIESCFAFPVFLSCCKNALHNIRELNEIIIFENNEEKAKKLLEIEQSDLGQRKNNCVFISYSSKDAEMAEELLKSLSAENITCWMAPHSIGISKNYQQEIPKGLVESGILLLLLSENSEKSRWVYKEVGTAIGMGHAVVPYKINEYNSSSQFNFLLDGEQIFPAYQYKKDDAQKKIIKIITRIIQTLQ